MTQIFSPSADTRLRGAALVAVLVVFGSVMAMGGYMGSTYATMVGWPKPQPVPFSHKHHAGDLGIDCRFCHVGVETGAKATVPTTQVCMTCHSQMWTSGEMLGPVRKSLATGQPLVWSRVNRLPDYVYFDHHVHVRNNVPCAACHGALQDMPLTRAAAPMTMQWCLDCHRAPERRMVPADRIVDGHPYDR